MRSRLQAFADFRRINMAQSPGTADAYVYRVQQFITWLEAQGRPAEPGAVTRHDIDAFMKDLFVRMRNSSPNTRAGKLSALKAYFGYLLYMGVIESAPTSGVPSPRISEPLPEIFTDNELRRLFSVSDTSTTRGLRDAALLRTLYATGIRRSEAVALNRGDLSDTGAFIHLKVFGKRRKERILTLRRRPAKHLRAWLITRQKIESPDNALFVTLKGAPHRLGSGGVENVLRKAARAAGVRKARLHMFRATWATHLYDAGVDLMEICAKAGWSSLETAKKYIRVSKRALNRAAIPDKYWRELELGYEDDGGSLEEF